MPKFSKCKILVGGILTIQHTFVKFVGLFNHQSFMLCDIFCCDQGPTDFYLKDHVKIRDQRKWHRY